LNLYDYSLPETGENFATLLEHKNVRIVRIVSSDKLEPTEYCQEEDEWVAVLEGEAELELTGEPRKLSRGEMLFIPARTPHKVLKTTPGTLWLAIHIF